MIEFLANWYFWIKALHIIFVVTWMAGIFYLPRLFVYHCRLEPGSEPDKMFQTMERKLFKVIMNPSMILVWIFGPLLVLAPQREPEPVVVEAFDRVVAVEDRAEYVVPLRLAGSRCVGVRLFVFLLWRPEAIDPADEGADTETGEAGAGGGGPEGRADQRKVAGAGKRRCGQQRRQVPKTVK